MHFLILGTDNIEGGGGGGGAEVICGAFRQVTLNRNYQHVGEGQDTLPSPSRYLPFRSSTLSYPTLAGGVT